MGAATAAESKLTDCLMLEFTLISLTLNISLESDWPNPGRGPQFRTMIKTPP
jgi:hypothetical protein